jgi:radical SAM protein with 4Fe4S-binding SPASM domain
MNAAQLKDQLNLLSKMSWKKYVNGASLITSYLCSKRTGKAAPKGLPISLAVEPTTACNLRCPECPSEPYLHPAFLDMVKYASASGVYTATSTNAHFLSDEMAKKTVESGLDRLIISIDGATQETYSAYRKEGRLEKVIQGTQRLVKWKKTLKSATPHLIFQCLVVKPNEHEVEDIKQIGRQLGVDEVRFKTAQIYDYENGSPLIPAQSKFSRYKKLDTGKWAIKNVLENECWKMWHSTVITWDGKVVPCCFDKDASHAMGSVAESSLAEIWNGKTYNGFRQALLTSRKEIDICKNCSEGGKIWAPSVS